MVVITGRLKEERGQIMKCLLCYIESIHGCYDGTYSTGILKGKHATWGPALSAEQLWRAARLAGVKRSWRSIEATAEVMSRQRLGS